MKNRLLKITLLTIVTAAIAGFASASRADDSTNAPAAATDNKPQKFYGQVSAVDTNAMTFTVGDQTFILTGESQVTRNSNPATISDIVVGDPARGSYTQGADGKLDITKVRFGKKAGGKSGTKKKKHSDSDTTDTNAPSATSGGQ
jgi:hypothetical protein